ncbi:MAG: hypothetical protein LBQ09_09030, partial [Acidobacteriaceae bacterium]|nr:hypothetical protein [Acidobacteriaceae bacterium]
GDAAPALTARILNRGGQPIATVPVTDAPQGNGAHDIDLTLTTLPPGEYLVEIAAKGGAAAPTQEVIGFRITS